MTDDTQNLIIIQCELCKARYKVPESICGRQVRCPKCMHWQYAEKMDKTGLPPVLTIGYLYGIIDRDTVQSIANSYNNTLKSGRKITIETHIKEQGLLDEKQLKLIEDSGKAWDLRQQEVGFGIMVIKEGLAPKETVDKLLRYQVDNFSKKREIVLIGDIMVASGLLTESKKNEFLARQGRKPSKYSFINDKVAETLITSETEKSGTEKKEGIPEEIDTKSFEIRISEDRITAYILLINQSAHITVDEIRKEAERSGIVYGLVDDSLVEGFLKYHKQNQKTFKLAQGIPPEYGRNASVNYFFDTEYLKPGAMSDNDQNDYIDFRDRGTIPFVRAGDVIAEKIPAIKKRDGLDVFGQLIAVPEISDIFLSAGNSAELSEDGLKVTAMINGQPVLSFGGSLSVLSEIRIKGDVGYQTGHVTFEGNIIINGTVQNGFRVSGNSVTAAEVAGGIIESSGNVTVTGGVTDATINCTGTLRAKFLNSCSIQAYGDVIVKNEIIDSRIMTSGTLEIKGGSVISSEICAKRGVIVKDIGSETSKACKVKIGTLDHEKLELGKIEARLHFYTEWKKKIETLTNGLISELKKNQEEQTKFAHMEDRAGLEIKSLRAALSEAVGNQESAEINEKITQLQLLIDRTEIKIQKLFSDQEAIEMQLGEEPRELEKTKQNIKNILAEKKGFEDWMNSLGPIPVMSVDGIIASGTVVTGIDSAMIMQNTLKKVKIHEIRINSPQTGSQYEMIIKSIK